MLTVVNAVGTCNIHLPHRILLKSSLPHPSAPYQALLHSWTLQVQQHFPEVQLFAEPLEPQALAVCAGGIPKPGFTGTSPLLPASSCTGKTQGSFFLFHSPSGAGRTPKGREATRGIGVGKQLSFSTLEKRICGPQGWIWCWESVQGISAHLATVC